MSKEFKDLKVGDKISFNEKARVFTKDLTFVIDDIKSWGVKCHVDINGGTLHYNATWDEISN